MGKAVLCPLKIRLWQQLPKEFGDILVTLYKVTHKRCHGRNQALVQTLSHPRLSARCQPSFAVTEPL